LNRSLLAALTLFAALLLAPPAGAAACNPEGGEDTAPVVSETVLTPTSLPWEGGAVVAKARVEDDCGIQQVYAEGSSTGGTYVAFQMLPFEVIDGNTAIYKGEFTAGPNYEEWEVGYQITVSAWDTNGAFGEAYAGEVSVAGLPAFDEAPYVSGADVTPRYVGTEGGWVTISADVSDTRNVAGAFAILTLPDGTAQEVRLEPVSFSHFVGYYKAPANFDPLAKKYSVQVYGEDDAGQQASESAGTFSVAGRPGPLSAVIERTGSFGNVTVGKTATRVVTIHNSNAAGTKWIKASLSVSGSSFSLRNAVAGKIDIAIGPGETRRFWLDFKPTALGPATGSLTLSRTDGAQPPTVLSLSGKGIPPAA
jgi:hypothetical protein